jgi:hypothetical protein
MQFQNSASVPFEPPVFLLRNWQTSLANSYAQTRFGSATPFASHSWLTGRGDPVFGLRVATGRRRRVQDFSGVEGLRKKIVCAKIQRLRPQAFVSQSIGHDQRRRMLQLLHLVKKFLPAVAVSQASVADDNSDRRFTQQGLCLRKFAGKPQPPIRMSEYTGERRSIFRDGKDR